MRIFGRGVVVRRTEVPCRSDDEHEAYHPEDDQAAGVALARAVGGVESGELQFSGHFE